MKINFSLCSGNQVKTISPRQSATGRKGGKMKKIKIIKEDAKNIGVLKDRWAVVPGGMEKYYPICGSYWLVIRVG